MTGDRDPARLGDYRAARIGAGVALTVVLIVVLLIDAVSPTYEVSPAVEVPLLTAIVTLFGIEAAAFFRGAK